jgi:hypothetical protein
VVTELLSLEVDEEVAVPRIIRSDVKEMFVGKVGVDGGTGGVRGEGRDKFGENEGLLALRCRELKVILLKDNDPSSEFVINLPTTEQVLHRVRICDDLCGAKQNVMALILDCEDNCKSKYLFVFILQGWS